MDDIELLALLWDHLKRDPEHVDRRQTGWGTKTQTGLLASIRRLTIEHHTTIGPDPVETYLKNAARESGEHSPEAETLTGYYEKQGATRSDAQAIVEALFI